MNSRKLLVLGSDYNAINVVREAKKMGLYVIVSDLMATSPAKELADESWLVSTTDIDLLVDKCKKNDVSALMFGASDFNINNCRTIAKRLSLPIYCDDDYTWLVARDKAMFKDICQKVGAPVATDYILTDELVREDLDKINYPVVVKPSDKSGNRGMSYCSNEDELIKAYKLARSISDNERIIVERRLYGTEYNVHYALADGEASLLYFSSTHHQSGEKENLYSFKCTTSYHLKQYIEEVNDKAIDVIKAVGCRDGIAWFDIMRDADGKFYLLEMGYRFGGVMTYTPYEKVSGFNTIKWMIECALGVKHKKSDLPKSLNEAYRGCAGSYHLFTVKDGVIGSVKGLDTIKELPNVWVDMPKRTGDEVRYNACMGLIGIYGEDINEMCQTLDKINNVLEVENPDGENMIIYFDDYGAIKNEYNIGLDQFDFGGVK